MMRESKIKIAETYQNVKVAVVFISQGVEKYEAELCSLVSSRIRYLLQHVPVVVTMVIVACEVLLQG